MQSPPYAGLVLLLEVAIGLGLLLGAWLARKRKFREHAWCQSAAVLLNLIVVVSVMVPSFRTHISPNLPAKLGKSYVALATAHAALGGMVELTALYILLAAGTKLLPERLRLQRYQLWMRAVLAGWWLALLLGAATYVRWYVPLHFRH
jgi:predicted permease